MTDEETHVIKIKPAGPLHTRRRTTPVRVNDANFLCNMTGRFPQVRRPQLEDMGRPTGAARGLVARATPAAVEGAPRGRRPMSSLAVSAAASL
jgi:hypothetical protein